MAYRVYRVVQCRRGKMVLARQVVCPLLLLLQVALATTVTLELIYPPDFQIIQTYGYCYPLGSIESKAHTIGQIVLEIPLQIAILLFAWKLRNLNETIGESRRIFHLSCFQLGIWIIHWAIQFLVVRANVFGLEANVATNFYFVLVRDLVGRMFCSSNDAFCPVWCNYSDSANFNHRSNCCHHKLYDDGGTTAGNRGGERRPQRENYRKGISVNHGSSSSNGG